MKRQLSLAIGLALLGAGSTAFAVTDTETNASVPFNLANPGARSMGLGGAFLGSADDATAAYSNPAGLTQLVTPEVSAEVRHTEYNLPFVNGGTASADPFDGSGLHTSHADSSINNLSFLSVVFPHDRWSFAGYRNELVNFHTNFETGLDGELVPGVGVAFPVSADAHLKIVDYGFSAAFKAGDNVSLGAGISYFDFDINTIITRRNYTGTASNANIPDIGIGTPVNRQEQFGSDSDYGINLGARIVLTEQLSLGLTYRRGPQFNYHATNTPLVECDNNDNCSSIPTGSQVPTVDLKDARFKVPDQFGAGLSWHPTDALVVNFDLDYIQYSQLTRGIQSLFGNDPTIASRLSIPNGTEIHIGGEYTFTQMSHPLSLRAGAWHDPRHSIQFKGDPGDFRDANGDPEIGAVALATLFHGGQGSQNHFALGLGWAFTKFQIDAAADFSNVTDTFSMSAVYHF